MGEERRAYQRVDVEQSARFTISEFEDSSFAEATVVNISPEGLCFLSRGKVETGQTGHLKINPDTEEEVDIHFEVVWVKEFEGNKGYMVGVKVKEAQNPQ